MQLECYPTASRPPDLVPGRPQRGWMEAFAGRHPTRCLPLTMANTTGWEILCPVGFSATWTGGMGQADVILKPDHPFPQFDHFVKSHFTHGVITFHPGYLFRTPPGWSLMAGGPPNHIKDGVQPLVGLVETDWLPFPFTMNWRFTRPGTVKFAKGEPFCFILPVQDKPVEQFDVVQKSLQADDELRGQYEAWTRQRADFNKKIHQGDPHATKEAWQRFYFRGEYPEETGSAPENHVNKRRLKSKRLA